MICIFSPVFRDVNIYAVYCGNRIFRIDISWYESKSSTQSSFSCRLHDFKPMTDYRPRFFCCSPRNVEPENLQRTYYSLAFINIIYLTSDLYGIIILEFCVIISLFIVLEFDQLLILINFSNKSPVTYSNKKFLYS